MKEFKHEKDKDPLEKLFRDRADDFDIEYREDDWRALESRLDLLDAKAAYRFKTRLISAAAAILILLFGYFTFHNYNRINELSDQIAQAVQNNGTSDEAAQHNDTLRPIIPDTDTRETGETESTESDLNRLAELMGEPVEDSEMPLNRAGEYGDRDNFTDETVNREMLSANVFYDRIPVTGEFSSTVNSEEIVLPEVYFTSINSAPTGKFSSLYAYPDDNEDEDIRSIMRSSESSGITVGLALSPDATGAGTISGFSDPGYKAGAIIEYAISNALSVSVGIIQTEVRYRASSSEYNPPYYWLPGTSPDEILATCLMFDIPITLKYNLFNFNRSRLYSSVSLSSYIMQNEVYRFQYGNGTTGGPERWSGKTGKGYWFSNAGFSIGYEFDLNQNWALRAEPFIRLPISEVGWGKAKLYSVGSFISLNYRL